MAAVTPGLLVRLIKYPILKQLSIIHDGAASLPAQRQVHCLRIPVSLRKDFVNRKIDMFNIFSKPASLLSSGNADKFLTNNIITNHTGYDQDQFQ